MESVSKARVYIKGILESISRAGKALSGWSRPTTRVQQPNCVFITEGNITKVENLMIKLFQCSVPQMKRAGRLWPLANCLLATVLMYLSEMMTEYPRHRVLVTLKEHAIDCDITMKELLEWGAIVKEKFASDHAIAIHSGIDLIPVIFERMVGMENRHKADTEVSSIVRTIYFVIPQY